jgi:hypothetical protein
MKQFYYDYHSEIGFLNRAWIEAESAEEAEKIARQRCGKRCKYDEGSLTEIKNQNAVNEFYAQTIYDAGEMR